VECVEEVVAERFRTGVAGGVAEEFVEADAKASAGGALREVQVAEQIAQCIAWGIGRVKQLVLPCGHADAF